MAKVILIDTKKRDAKAKATQIEVCFQQREAQIRKYESRNPFSMQEWMDAFKCGWLRQHNLSYWSFPSPTAHFRKLWEESSEPWFAKWREESSYKQKRFLRRSRKSK